MSPKRGDVVVATDPFKDGDAAGRPFLLIDRAETPFHGEQSIALALTTDVARRPDSAHERGLGERRRSGVEFHHAVVGELAETRVDHRETRDTPGDDR